MIDNLNRKQDSYWERSGEHRPIWFQFLSIATDDLRLKEESSLLPETRCMLEMRWRAQPERSEVLSSGQTLNRCLTSEAIFRAPFFLDGFITTRVLGSCSWGQEVKKNCEEFRKEKE